MKILGSENKRRITTALATFFGVFTGSWAILEPLGGFDLLVNLKNQVIVYYAFLLVLSVAFSVIILLIGETGSNKQATESTAKEFIAVGKSRTEFDYLGFLRDSVDRVQLLGLSLDSFANERAVALYKELIQRRIMIQVMLVNPLSPNLSQRSPDLYSINHQVRIAGATTLKTLNKLRLDFDRPTSDFIDIHILNILPTIGIFRVDNKLLWNPYFMMKTGLGSPYFLQRVDSVFGDFVVNNFEELWNNYSFKIPKDLNTDTLVDVLKLDSYSYEKLDEQVILKVRTILD